MPGVPIILTPLVWLSQVTRITRSLCISVCSWYACPPTISHTNTFWIHWSIHQIWAERSNSWTFFYIRHVAGEKKLYSGSYWVSQSPQEKAVLLACQVRSQLATTPGNAPGNPSRTIQSSHLHGFSRLRWGKDLSKLWPHIIHSFSCIVHSICQIHICKHSLKVISTQDRNPLKTRLPPLQLSQKYWFIWPLQGLSIHKDPISQGSKTFASLLPCQDQVDTLLTAVHCSQARQLKIYTRVWQKQKKVTPASECSPSQPPLPCWGLCVQVAIEKQRDRYYMEPASWPTSANSFHKAQH